MNTRQTTPDVPVHLGCRDHRVRDRQRAGVTFGASRIGAQSGVLVMALVAAAFAAWVFLRARRNPVNASNVNDPVGTPAAAPVHAGAAA
ncbi:MAG TPA: hypothetical protein VIM10_07825 [Actinopolymorphaceae bacterium]|jgi:hypothetical protein